MTTPTTFEPHTVYCQTCEADLGDCTEPGCVYRYAHAVEVCEACWSVEGDPTS